MGKYFRYFRWYFLCVGILAAVYGGILLLHGSSDAGVRTNGECLTQERVFDYGEVLSEKEEEKLRELIARRERQTGCDIVLVTLRESLEEYAREREAGVPYDEFVRVYAEEFYDGNRFGYDKPIGDGILLVDNWYREADGNIYSWLCAAGRADRKYNLERMDHLLDQVYRYVERNPYKAYRAYINEFYHDMAGSGANTSGITGNGIVPVAAALAAMFLFAAVHWKSRKGKKTVTAATYVNGGKPYIKKREDILLHKTVTQRKIQTNSGSSGSGGSSGSHSHGGHHGGAGHHR